MIRLIWMVPFIFILGCSSLPKHQIIQYDQTTRERIDTEKLAGTRIAGLEVPRGQDCEVVKQEAVRFLQDLRISKADSSNPWSVPRGTAGFKNVEFRFQSDLPPLLCYTITFDVTETNAWVKSSSLSDTGNRAYFCDEGIESLASFLGVERDYFIYFPQFTGVWSAPDDTPHVEYYMGDVDLICH